jgi:hypothetical protein
MGSVMDPRFYENDFMFGKDSELEVMRSPFYDLAKAEKLDKEAASQLMDEVTLKLNYLEGLDVLLQPPAPTKENVAFKRYADKALDEENRTVFEFPKGQPYKIINNAELFRIQRTSLGEDRWAPIKRSKPFLSSKFFPPFDLKENNLRKLLIEQKDKYSLSQDSQEYL